MPETLFALVLIFSPTPQYQTEEVYARNLPFATCDAAQKSIWAEDAEIVGLDGEGFPIPSFDAYCVDMSAAPQETIKTTYFY
jgi:hypothetical protein